MSFDLYIYFPHPSADFAAAWNAALKRRGIVALVVAEHDTLQEGEMVLCNPESDDENPEFCHPEDGALFEFGTYGNRAREMADDAEISAGLRERLKLCEYSAGMQWGRGEYFAWQASTLPALLEVTKGIMWDPQLCVTEALEAEGHDNDMTRMGLFATPEEAELWVARLFE